MTYIRLDPKEVKNEIVYKDYITFGKSKAINLPQTFLVKNNFNSSKECYAVLFFDPEKKTVAIHPQKNRGDVGLKIVYDKRGHGASISSAQFIKRFKLDLTKITGRYEYKIEHNNKLGILYTFKLEADEKAK